MSKKEDIRYYLLVIITGILSSIVSIGLYLVYTELWRLTENALAYSNLLFIPIAFAAIGLSYLLVKRFAHSKTTGSGTSRAGCDQRGRAA